jgi:excisionase family DNA binding protein
MVAMDEYLSTEELAERLGLSARTLEGWRVAGTGPPYTKIGHRVRYAVADVVAWLAEQKRLRTTAARLQFRTVR